MKTNHISKILVAAIILGVLAGIWGLAGSEEISPDRVTIFIMAPPTVKPDKPFPVLWKIHGGGLVSQTYIRWRVLFLEDIHRSFSQLKEDEFKTHPQSRDFLYDVPFQQAKAQEPDNQIYQSQVLIPGSLVDKGGVAFVQMVAYAVVDGKSYYSYRILYILP